MSLALKLEATPGDTIGEVAREMCDLADELGVTTRVRFNGVELNAKPGADWQVLEQKYQKTPKLCDATAIVYAHPGEGL
ncbi:MAG: hypothetical protein KI788_15800 [Mameliella sp.]|nr:hypothetical protein [Mameliella sp.]